MAFAGFRPSEKLWLIRKLIEERTKGSLSARWFLDLSDVDDVILMGSPGATIVTIVENFRVLRANALAERHLLQERSQRQERARGEETLPEASAERTLDQPTPGVSGPEQTRPLPVSC
jgi:hypothetical protein